MKNKIHLAVLGLAVAAVPSFAQNTAPSCGATNYDASRGLYTILDPNEDAVNQQCFITVYKAGQMPRQLPQGSMSYLTEGTYEITLSGGGGGGGGGSTSKGKGGGGGGAGAAPWRTTQYLAPGQYRVTLGSGGEGGDPNDTRTKEGPRTENGNPTSLTNVTTGTHVAGFMGAETWRQTYSNADGGEGGEAMAGGSAGGSGGDRRSETAESGTVAYTEVAYGQPGRAGDDSGRIVKTNYNTKVGNQPVTGRIETSAGGGGGAGFGNGGDGGSTNGRDAQDGTLGGGGGGGAGGQPAQKGGNGGHGFIKLVNTAPAVVAMAPRTTKTTRAIQSYTLTTEALFDFNKATLKPAGKAKLNDIAEKLQDTNVGSIVTTGHADRIGTDSYNQELSERRAEAVKAYLASRGVERKMISAEGKGESQPVTDPDSCKGRTSPSVIACLQPDRRVEIEAFAQEESVTTTTN